MNYSFPTQAAAAGQSSSRASTLRNQSAAGISSSSGAPFLKWAGSKRRLLSQLLPLLPQGQRLIEPFVGAGSVFMASRFKQYLLADTNAVLMAVYGLLQTDPAALVSQAQALFVEGNRSTEAYNALRSKFNDPATLEAERAVLFIYLNKFGFNGLYRVNKRGQMNVPFAHHDKLPAFPTEATERFAAKLGQAQLLCTGFEDTMAQARPGDVVYCDPPYVDREDAQGNASASFTAYSQNCFGMAQQEKLASLARELAEQGIPVVVSNHDTPTARRLYAGATLHTVHAHRSMASNIGARGKVAELVAVFGG